MTNNSLSNLPAGVFDNLTKLDFLALHNTSLSNLPAGVFDNLTALRWLYLSDNSLSSLPAGVFDNLTALESLSLENNSLSSLPAGVFDNLTALESLSLKNNSLSSLPAGVFDNLTALESLSLENNSLSSLPAGVFDNLTALESLTLYGNSNLSCLPFISSSVTLFADKAKTAYASCGAAVTVSLSSVSVGATATSVYTLVLAAYPNGNVTVTPVSSDAGKATVSGPLTFTQSNWSTPQQVTVTGVAQGSTRISHTVSGGGYDSATTADVAVTVTPSHMTSSAVTAATATLTIANHTGHWWYKYTIPTGGRCSSNAVTTSAVNVQNLSSNTDYTFKAYSNNSCTTELASRNLLTKPGKPAKPVASTGAGSGMLTLKASVTGSSTLTKWQYQQKEGAGTSATFGSWIDISSTSTALSYTVTGLTNGTDYQFKVRAVNVTGDGVASDASAVASVSATTILAASEPNQFSQRSTVTLTPSDVQVSTATLTIANHTGHWWYKYTTPTGGSCSSNAVTTSVVHLRDLSSNTDYTFKAYGDQGCTTEIATATFTTRAAPSIAVSPTALTVREAGNTASYTIVLKSRPTAPVTVTPLSRDTTVATVSPASLRFTAGNWSVTQTVTVRGVEDEDTRDETTTIGHDVVGGDYEGLTVQDVTVTVEDVETQVRQRINAAVEDVTPEVSSAISANTANAVAERVVHLTQGVVPVGSPRISWGNLPTTPLGAMELARRWADGESINIGELLDDSHFSTAAAGHDTGEGMEERPSVSPWGVWGTVDYGKVAAEEYGEGRLEWDAEVLTGLVGADRFLSDKLLAGAALAWSTSSFDYHTSSSSELVQGEGEGRMELFSINPYMGWTLAGGNSVWATLGYGWGELTIDDAAIAEETTLDLRQWSVAGGVSGLLYQSGSSGEEDKGGSSQLLWKTDAWFSSMHIADDGILEDDQQQTHRLRFGLEGNRSINLANDGLLTPSLALFYRYEGGDGATGSGLDLAAGLRYETPSGLRLEGRGRTLLLHSDGLKDWGLSALFSYAPQGREGLSVSLSPTWGQPEFEGLQQLWQSRDGAVLAPGGETVGALQLDGELRYGQLPWGRYQLSPAMGFNVSADGWTVRASAELELSTSFNLDLELSRQDPAQGEADHAIGLSLELDF